MMNNFTVHSSSILFRSSNFSLAISSKTPSKSPQGSSYSFILHSISSSFCHRSSSWWFFMIQFILQVFIKILVQGVLVSSLLASRSAINSSYSFEVEFCISLLFPDIQAFGCGVISPQVFELFLDKSTRNLFFRC